MQTITIEPLTIFHTPMAYAISGSLFFISMIFIFFVIILLFKWNDKEKMPPELKKLIIPSVFAFLIYLLTSFHLIVYTAPQGGGCGW